MAVNPWFRMYAEFAHDPKVQMLSEAMQRRLTMLLCLRCSNDLVTLQDDAIAFQLRISLDDLAETKAIFVAKGFIDEAWKLLNWDKRQFISDSSYERVKRHREKRTANGLPQQNYIPASVRKEVHERDGNACVYCGATEDLTIDHDMPQSRGGGDEVANLLTACRACNAGKRDLTNAEYVARNKKVTLPKRSHIQNRTETDKENIPPGFARFWLTWPKSDRKEAKGKCLEVWVRAGAEAHSDRIVAHIERLKASVGWTKDGGEFIPAPLTYLNKKKWEGVDEAVADWWLSAGFSDRFEAENSGCREHNVAQFHDGKRDEVPA